MKYLVIADFRCKPGMARRMAELFEDALPVTRSFQGCRSVAVYYEERTQTFTLLEDLGFPTGIRGLPRLSRRYGNRDTA